MATDLARLRELLERIWKLCDPILPDHPGPSEHVRIFPNFKETLGQWGASCTAVSADMEGAAKWCDRLKRADDANWLRSANIRLNELWNSTFANLTPEVRKVLFQPLDGENIEQFPDGGMHIPWLERAGDYNGSNLCAHIRRVGSYARQLLQSLEADEAEQTSAGGSGSTETATKEHDGDAGVDPRPAATVNMRMLAALTKNPDCRNWSAQQWATHLGCSKSTVAETNTWKSLKAVKGGVALGPLAESANRHLRRRDDDG